MNKLNNKIKAVLAVIGFLLSLTIIAYCTLHYPDFIGLLLLGGAAVFGIWTVYGAALNYFEIQDKLKNK